MTLPKFLPEVRLGERVHEQEELDKHRKKEKVREKVIPEIE